ncbi:hypothetical protein [Sphingobacterium paludis]|uniref:Uncharacterized protein n=1 Tax=Sphingobacterium paludis TaxID=1476465 RepID=A0A4R7D2M5_9SPHI|nr:hypothetical protein [Sphingobacterium paludis]TDS13855.1 hypothetical protein B0I21_104181 [Sphingobacterium paludis]
MAKLTLHEQVKKGTVAVKALRLKRLKNGLPFMINVKGMEEKCCYLEYPDGNIHRVKRSSKGNDFDIIEILDQTQAMALKSRFQLD